MDTGTILTILIIALLVWFGYKPLILDAREPGEYKGGYIAGAKNLPLSQLSRRLSEVPPDRPVLLYCRSGMRSQNAAKLLIKNGHQDLAHLQGGLNA
ncbi:rhodanese-like domain-containing protein [Paenibacillus sp. CC-CFT747]|nr:rhodanese-like domain-containing protein [Paenibacillus sp. CC-CFT747]